MGNFSFEPNKRLKGVFVFSFYVDLVFRLPIKQSYTYLLPEEMIEKAGIKKEEVPALIGRRVEASLRGRRETGAIVSVHQNPPAQKALPIERIIDKEAVWNQEQLELSKWMADYYLSSRGQAIFKMLPAARRLPKSNRAVGLSKEKRDLRHTLNEEQKEAFLSILSELSEKECRGGVSKNGSNVHLLHGITGSGKTEIYIQTIFEFLRHKKTALLLVPEIALTVQLIRRLKGAFGDEIALLHSGLKASERMADYMALCRGHKRVAVGTRSAVFAPLKNIGIIIIDEEHDNSFKEHSSPRYDARQIAYYRAKKHGAALVLGSATPRIESRYFAEKGEFFYHRLRKRATGAHLPEVQIVPAPKSGIPISGRLLAEIEKNLNHKEKTLLLLNRRGYNPVVRCMECEKIEECPSCAVSMNLHFRGRRKSHSPNPNQRPGMFPKSDAVLLCHYCGFVRPFDGLCVCEKRRPLETLGSGIQKLEEYLLNLYPEARIERLDSDVGSRRGAVEDSIGRLIAGDLDILVGTQMIAKGLDAPEITLVGVLQADAALSMPDFRASERVFSLLTQVAGRSGRGKNPGRVILECLDPKDPLIELAGTQNYDAFFQEELALRKTVGYPPYTRLIRFLYRSENKDAAELAIAHLAEKLNAFMDSNTKLLGPAPAPIEKLHDKYRYHLILKTQNLKVLRSKLAQILSSFPVQQAHLEIDIDPVDLL